jgi:hypothetical protein
VTVKQAVVDGMGMYVLCDVTAPEGFEFNDKVYTKGASLDFEDESGNTSHNYSWKTIEDIGNKRTVIIYSATDSKIKNNSDVELTLEEIYYAEYFEDGSYDVHTLIEGDWIVTFRIEYVDMAKTIAVNKKVKVNDTNDNTITTVSISPTSVIIKIEGDDLWTAFNPIIKMRSGEEIIISSDNNAYNTYSWRNLDVLNERGRFNEDGSIRKYGEYYIGHRFKNVTDISDIESIVIGDVTIPIE